MLMLKGLKHMPKILMLNLGIRPGCIQKMHLWNLMLKHVWCPQIFTWNIFPKGHYKGWIECQCWDGSTQWGDYWYFSRGIPNNMLHNWELFNVEWRPIHRVAQWRDWDNVWDNGLHMLNNCSLSWGLQGNLLLLIILLMVKSVLIIFFMLGWSHCLMNTNIKHRGSSMWGINITRPNLSLIISWSVCEGVRNCAFLQIFQGNGRWSNHNMYRELFRHKSL